MATPKVAAIHDLSGFGRCSLTVALPVLSAMGVQCCPLPTAFLSTHTGGFEGFTFLDMTEEMPRVARHWASLGLRFDAIYSGFLAGRRQIGIVSDFIRAFRTPETRVIVDPVMGDDGSIYQTYTPELCAGMAELTELADVITPNLTEAALLLGWDYASLFRPDGRQDPDRLRQAMEELSRKGTRSVALTGVSEAPGRTGAMCYDARTGCLETVQTDFVSHPLLGTGDIFASVLTGALVKGKPLPEAARQAAEFICACAERTVEEDLPLREGVDFEPLLGLLTDKEGDAVSRIPDIKQVSWGYYRMQIGFWGMLGSFNGFQTAIVLDRGFTSGQAGIFMAASCLSGILCQPILGNWADRHPEVSLKWLFAALMAPAVALNLLFYWTRPAFLPTLLIFLLLGVLELNSYPIIDSMAMQYINTGMDVPYSLGRGLGAFSYAVVCVVEGQLTQRLGVQSALLIHFALQLVMIGFCAAFPSFPKEALPPREVQAQPHSAWQLLRSNKPFSLMLAGCFFGMVAVMPIVSFLVNMVEAKGGDSGDLGLALFLMAASELPAAFVFQWLRRRMSSQRILLVSIVFMILKPLLFMASGSLTMLLLVQPIQLFGYGLFTPANAYFANESVAPEDRIQGQSLKSLLTSGLGNVVGSLLSGFILDWGGVNAMLAVCALSGCIGLCFGIAAVRCGNKQ